MPSRGAPIEGPLSNAELERHLKALAREHDEWIGLSSLGRSREAQEVWLLTLGPLKRDAAPRPSLLLVAGIEGDDLPGTASALHWVSHLAAASATNEAVKEILARHTLYIIPRANPDAEVAHVQSPLRESKVDTRPFDDDHDGLIDEDGPEDLDRDGRITWMRVRDPEGDHIPDPHDARLLIKADPVKGETGAWKLLVEGRDNDGDERWNEDGPGGVNFNRNFPYGYAFFAPDAGPHQISEPITRALADFVVDHPEIAVVFTFGTPDNLTQAPKGEAGGKRPPEEIDNADLPFYQELGKAWRDAIGLKKETGGNRQPGSFSDWIYFHRGRLSLAARPWSPSLQLALPKPKETGETKEAAPDEAVRKEPEKPEANPEPKPATETDKGEAKEQAPRDEGRNKEEREFLDWLVEAAPAQWVPWKPFDHPDFPGQTVEIGGYAPHAKTWPPPSVAATLREAHAKFLTDLAGKLPRVGIRKLELKALGRGVFDLTVQVENTGYLPASLAQGRTTREVHPTRIELGVDAGDVLAGSRRVLEGELAGSGGMREVRWVFLARQRASVEVRVTSMLGGSVVRTIELKEAQP